MLQFGEGKFEHAPVLVEGVTIFNTVEAVEHGIKYIRSLGGASREIERSVMGADPDRR
jgi:hypothetical protein